MSKFLTDMVEFCFDYPIAVVIILIELFAIVFIIRFFVVRKENLQKKELIQKQKRLDEFYEGITNPEWIEHGGTKISFSLNDKNK